MNAGSTDIAVGARRLVAPQHHLAAAPVQRGVRGDMGCRVHPQRVGVGGVATALIVASHQHGAATGGAGRVDRGAFVQCDVRAGDRDCAAPFAIVGTRRIQRTGDIDHAARSAA